MINDVFDAKNIFVEKLSVTQNKLFLVGYKPKRVKNCWCHAGWYLFLKIGLSVRGKFVSTWIFSCFF